MRKDNTYDKVVRNNKRRRNDGYDAAAVKYGLPKGVQRYVEEFVRPKKEADNGRLCVHESHT